LFLNELFEESIINEKVQPDSINPDQSDFPSHSPKKSSFRFYQSRSNRQFTPPYRMDLDEAFAACIRTGNASGITALGVDRSTINELLVCDTPVPSTPGQSSVPLLHRPRPVIYAILCHQLPVVEKLADLGADLAQPLYDGWGPIHFAVAVRDWGVSQFLLTRIPSELESKTEHGATPLHIAVSNGDFLTTVGLLELGADPNFPNQNGNTALHLAMVHDKMVASALVAYGAKTEVVNSQNLKPIQIAEKRGNADVVAYLKGLEEGKIQVGDKGIFLEVLRRRVGVQQEREGGGEESFAIEIDLLSQRLNAVEEALAMRG
jgi:hypothetical protein